MTSGVNLKQVYQATVGTLVLIAAWQIASYFFPHYLFPPVQTIVVRTVSILINWPELKQVLETAARIFAGLTGAFLLGCLVALVIGRSPKIESYITPLLVFLQGIPALSWVIIAIIWFHGTEFRIFFIMVITTLPAFTFQILDAYRSMSKDLFEMTMSFRPSCVDPVPRADRADHRAGHPDRLEGQPRQRRARRRGGGAGRRDRRRRLRASCVSSSCSTWRARWRGPSSSCCSYWSCSRRSSSWSGGCCATGRFPSGRHEPRRPSSASTK